MTNFNAYVGLGHGSGFNKNLHKAIYFLTDNNVKLVGTLQQHYTPNSFTIERENNYFLDGENFDGSVSL